MGLAHVSDLPSLFKHVLFSDFGLLVMLIFYVLGGIHLFQAIEFNQKQDYIVASSKRSHQIEDDRRKMAEDMWKYKWQANFSQVVEQMLFEYQQNVSDAIINNGYSTGKPLEESNFTNGWSFNGALLFTLSVVTSIGYGQVYPVTEMGQFVCMFYALFGIPLNLLFLSNVGFILAKWFHVAYNRGCCYICWKQRKATFKAKRCQLIYHLKTGHLTENDLRQRSTKELEAHIKEEKEFHIGAISDDTANKILKEDIKVWSQFVEIVGHVDEDKNVPISLILIVMSIYLFIGTLLFAMWNDWSYIKAAYFCFITLATVGFGDVLPGEKDNMQRIAMYVYIYFGLAVISMSFNLMMEEMGSKVTWVLKKLGLHDEPKKPVVIEDMELMGDHEGIGAAHFGMTSVPERFHESDNLSNVREATQAI